MIKRKETITGVSNRTATVDASMQWTNSCVIASCFSYIYILILINK